MATASTTSPAPASAPEAANTPEVRPTVWQLTLRHLRPAIVLTLVLTIITGLAYPAAITGLAQLFFPSQANGSLVYKNGQPVASELIGQYWTQPQYFHGRPSATSNLAGTPAPYEADNSGGSNIGPTNSSLVPTIQQRIDQLKKENPDVPVGTQIPIDLVTASASGVDPDISVAAAYYQIPRIAKARGMTQAQVRQIVDSHVQGRFLGLFGDPYLNVLDLNLALDKAQGK